MRSTRLAEQTPSALERANLLGTPVLTLVAAVVGWSSM
jgi:hypothetical protein